MKSFKIKFKPILVSICLANLSLSLVYSQNKPIVATSPVDTTKLITEQKLSIDVKDTDIRDVIRMISKGYNLNILLDNDVTGKVTLHLTEVPTMEALKNIAESNGLEVIKEGNVYKIHKATAEKRSTIRFADGKLTVDVQNVDVKDFLKELSSKTAVSIVPDAKVSGTLTGKLYQVTLDDGLRALLEGNGFKVTKRRNIYQVATGSDDPMAGGQQMNRTFRASSGGMGGSNFFVEYANGKVSIEVSNGDLEDVIKAITDQSEIEIITYGRVQSEINAKLHDVPLTQALALLLGGTRYTFVQKDNVILIGDRNTATPSGQALSKSELVHLKHIKADNVPSILPKDIPSTNVRVIKEQNALLISGTSEDIVLCREFLNTVDIPTPQVRIDAVIVEYKDNLGKDLGIRYGKASKLINSSYLNTPSPDMKYFKKNSDTEIGASIKTIKDVAEKIFSNIEMGVLDKLDNNFFIAVKMLENQNKARVLAQPSILTLNGNKASIDVSETQYFKISAGTGENFTTRFQPIKFGIQLDIVPWISQSGQITAEITPNVSSSDGNNEEGYPNVSTRSITTTVRLNDGETLILGGLIKDQSSVVKEKVPILGDIPLLGVLFRRTVTQKSKSNLVVYITPHVVNKNEKINLQQELKEKDIQDKSFMERQVIKSLKKLGSNMKSGKDSIEHTTKDTLENSKPNDKKRISNENIVPVSLQPQSKKISTNESNPEIRNLDSNNLQKQNTTPKDSLGIPIDSSSLITNPVQVKPSSN